MPAYKDFEKNREQGGKEKDKKIFKCHFHNYSMEEHEGKEEAKENKEPEKSETKHEETKIEPQKTERPEDPKLRTAKPINKQTAIIITVVAIIVIVAILFFVFRGGKTIETEMLNITYAIKTENDTIDSGTSIFAAGSVASNLGFQTDKFDSEIASMQEGEEKDITLEAADAYGSYDEELVFSYNRTEKIDRKNKIDKIIEIPIQDFVEAFDEQPEVDKEYTALGAPWPIKVLEKNDTHVKVSQEAEVGDEIPQQIFIYEVTKVTDEEITLTMQGNDTILPTPSGNLEITFTDNYMISTLTPEIGQWIELQFMPKARVTGMDDDEIFLDANHELAGKEIIVSAKLNSRFIEKSTVTGAATIAGAPTMQVFIMSYCPYGLQMLKGMLPVMEKFQGKANIELRFVGYTMHGEKEEQENFRMICLREEQYSKLIPYLKCFAESGDAEACIAQAGVNVGKLDTCMINKATEYYKEDQALCDQYDVRGSPTTIINGEVAEGLARSPEGIKTALCEDFTTKPAECSETLSTESPSPGFGGGTSSSSNGVC